MADLTHIDGSGTARMVDVGGKPVTERRARARASLRMTPEAAARIARGDAPKGDVLTTARLAGIQAAKRTSDLVPLAHPLALTHIDVDATVFADRGAIEITAEVATVGRTGVEIEAMTACAVAALTVYDMAKAIERGIVIERIELVEKTGGRHDWRAKEDAGPDRRDPPGDAGGGESGAG